MEYVTGVAGRKAAQWAEDRVRLLGKAHSLEGKHSLIRRLERLLGAGRPLDEITRSQMESIFGYNLGEVRIHDSHQAQEVSRRLGAEAFTIKSHIFGPAEKLDMFMPQGAGLLAHEITHAIQQTEPSPVALATPQRQPLAPPLLGQPVPHSVTAREEKLSDAKGERDRAPKVAVAQFASPGSSRVPRGAVQREMEAEAQASEQAVKESLQSGNAIAPGIDPEEVADKVYRLMQQDLILERERGIAQI